MKKKRTLFAVLLTVFLVFSVAFVIIIGAFFMFVKNYVDTSADIDLFQLSQNDTVTRFYAFDFDSRSERQGELYELEGEQIRSSSRKIYKTFDELPEDLIDAFVAVEDKRFWEHNGVDLYRSGFAVANYFIHFKKSFGASTITQQLVKNVTCDDDISIRRKVQEMFWAIDIENNFSKKEILEMYLNIINLSQGCYGVGAAANAYFSKDVSELSLLECAAIAAITNSPSYYDPIRHPENNLQRRNLILSLMLEQDYISQAEFDECYNATLILNPDDSGDTENINSWYIDMVIEDVITDLQSEYGYSRSAASQLIYTGGLKIYTAMDERIQKLLDDYYAQAERFEASGLQSSMIIIEPSTGDILGVVGALGAKNANRIQNYATDTLRPSGSVIKPLSVYALALEKNLITWASVYDDVPISFKEKAATNESEKKEYTPWPLNADGIYSGLCDIEKAISDSVNTVAVKILSEIGTEQAFDFLKNTLGMESLLESKTLSDGSIISDKGLAALALGQMNYGITVREITAAYTALANAGEYCKARSYYKVTDSRGKILLSNDDESRRAISAENASIMTKLLQRVVSDGTASKITLDQYVECAGKTGTTQNNCDKWFIGYTPYYIGGVWCGYDYPSPIPAKYNNMCIDVWDDIMKILHEQYINGEEEPKTFKVEPNVVKYEYCVDSGDIPTPACLADARSNRRSVGYFVRGTEPKTRCNCHILVDYDSSCGGIAGDDCPRENIIKVGMIKVERDFPIQIYVTDAQYVWRYLPSDVLPGATMQEPFFINTIPKDRFCGISYGSRQFNCYCVSDFNYVSWILKHSSKKYS